MLVSWEEIVVAHKLWKTLTCDWCDMEGKGEDLHVCEDCLVQLCTDCMNETECAFEDD